MVIKGKRIVNIERHLIGIREGDSFYIGCMDLERHRQALLKAGFSSVLEAGERLLPAPLFGDTSIYNAEGLYIPRKDMPKEIAYRQHEWHLKDWGGYSHSGISDIPYERYPQRFIPPPSIELQISLDESSRKFISSDKLTFSKESYEKIKITINLFLELFGEFEIFTESLIPSMTAPTKRVYWEILPKGVYPWEKLKSKLTPIIERASKGNQPLIKYRLEIINKAKPDFYAIGEAGFYGYVIFGFEKKTLYVLESIYYGNATYVFEEGWEELSKKTKAEILTESLQKDRIIHREGWEDSINKLLKDDETI